MLVPYKKHQRKSDFAQALLRWV